MDDPSAHSSTLRGSVPSVFGRLNLEMRRSSFGGLGQVVESAFDAYRVVV